MPVFGEARNPTPWLGRLYHEYPGGYLVQEGTSTTFLRREHSKMFTDARLSDAALQQQWRQQHLRPVQDVPEPPARFKEVRPPEPTGKPYGSVVTVPVVLRLLTIKVDGLAIIGGTEEAGIGIEEDDVEVVAAGTGTVTVLEDGA